MGSELVKIEKDLPAIYTEGARQYAAASKAANTKRAYKAAWGEFADFCQERGFCPLPATVQAVVEYLTWLADKQDKPNKVSSIALKRSAISLAHTSQGFADPTKSQDVKAVISGIARVKGSVQNKKEPITLDMLKDMIAKLDTATVAGKRDKALLLVGFAGGFRRSELVAVKVEDVRINGKLVVTLPKSKTDQEGKGMTKHILPLPGSELCPLAALRDWLDAAHITSGYVFRRVDRWGHVHEDAITSQLVANIIKDLAKKAGLEWRNLSGHSLRAGFVTAAHLAGADTLDIMQQTGHKRSETVKEYIRDAGAGAGRAMLAAFGQEAVKDE